jgi:hypothetical protein
MYTISPHLSLSQLQVAKVASKLQSLPQAPYSADIRLSVMLFDFVLLPVSASDLLSISLNVSLGFLLFSPTLYLLLSLSFLTLFCFALLCVAVLSHLTSSLYLLFTVNLCLVSIKYK